MEEGKCFWECRCNRFIILFRYDFGPLSIVFTLSTASGCSSFYNAQIRFDT
ncbi:hypothetical protein PUN28_003934 [Cardiocondyla obscurior]|uniref:Uncharacterized protein n=1 Tax=Cardiocondyla obscurior TaxID=286306 RepID=A0AAW2GP93_9HYME